VLNRCALTRSLINRGFGFATANGSVPSISILISIPVLRSRAGTDRIRVSPSSMRCDGTATSNSAPSRIAAAVASLGARQAYLDGELCGVFPDGISSFGMIQAASDAGKLPNAIDN
jgi:hypothetical protein